VAKETKWSGAMMSLLVNADQEILNIVHQLKKSSVLFMVLRLDLSKNRALNGMVGSLLTTLLVLQRFNMSLVPLLWIRISNHYLQLSFLGLIKMYLMRND